MEVSTQAVEAKTEAAATQSETVVTQTTTEVDYEAALAVKDAEIAKIQSEKENYRRGLLKAKGKIPAEEVEVDDITGETMEEKFRRIAREELMSTKEAQLQADKEALLKAALKRTKELEVALKNRAQVTTTSGQGSNQDKPEAKSDNFFSDDQLKALKARGYDDKKIEMLKQNVLKAQGGVPPIIK